MTKEDNDVTAIRVVQEIWKKTCPECQKEITGISKRQVIYNFKLHHEACKKRMNKKKNKK